MKPLNIAMIGYGGIGRVHALGYRAIPFHYGLPAGSVNIVGVATTRPETAWEAGQEIGCDVWTTDYHELLARDDVDVVDVCVPNRYTRKWSSQRPKQASTSIVRSRWP